MPEPEGRPVSDLPRGLLRSPEELPLPHLPDDLHHQIDLARAAAEEKLNDELIACWAKWDQVEGLPARSPDAFFDAFVVYGVGLYEAFSDVYLKLKPRLADYLNWVEFGLKTQLCEEIAPLWPVEAWGPVETWGKAVTEGPYGAWERWMEYSCRLSDHPQHPRLEKAFERGRQQLIHALRSPLDSHWGNFSNLLLKALSRRTLHWVTAGKKQLTNPGVVAEGAKPVPRGRGRPSKFTEDQLKRASEAKKAGEENNEAAKILYDTKRQHRPKGVPFQRS